MFIFTTVGIQTDLGKSGYTLLHDHTLCNKYTATVVIPGARKKASVNEVTSISLTEVFLVHPVHKFIHCLQYPKLGLKSLKFYSNKIILIP